MIKQTVFFLEVDQEVDIAVGAHFAAGARAKDPDLASATLTSQRHELRTQAAEVFQGADCGNFSHVIRFAWGIAFAAIVSQSAR